MTRPDRAWWLTAAGAIGAFLLLRFWQPAEAGVSVCVFRNVLDLPCPGCGLTRAFSHLAHGQFEAMFTMHPMAPVLAGQILVGWLAWGFLGRQRLARILPRATETLALANLVPLLAIWLGRAATGSLPF